MRARRNNPRVEQLGPSVSQYTRALIGKAPPLPRQEEMPGMDVDEAAKLATRIRQGRRAKSEQQKEAARQFEFQMRALELPKPWQYINSKKELSYEYRYCDSPELALEYGVEPREFRADYAWPEYRLLVELQGGIWMQSAGHAHPQNVLRDMAKAQYAALFKWFLLPVSTDQVKSGEAVDWLQRVLIARGWKQ